MIGLKQKANNMKNEYDYIDIGNIKIGSVVKLWNSFYKITNFEGSTEKMMLLCNYNNKTSEYIDLNHEFVRVNRSVYEFDRFIPFNSERFEIRYKLFLKV